MTLSGLTSFLAALPAFGPQAPVASEDPAYQERFVHWENPHVHPLDATPSGSKLLAVNTPDNRLEVFDVTEQGPTWAASIPVGVDPVSVRVRSEHEAWVVNHVSDSISVVNLLTRNVEATLPTDDEPADVVFAGSRAFVTCSQANTVLVFALDDLKQTAVRLQILGEDPRAMAVANDGSAVYAAIFESGNRSTLVKDVLEDPAGPYGGVVPPPNSGRNLVPPMNPDLPAPPVEGLIVKQDEEGRWMDDNGGDWSAFVDGDLASHTGRVVGWSLYDHDVAVIDTATLEVSYVKHLMNLCMAVEVHPTSGELFVVGTEATNEVRFEPNLNGRFLRVQAAFVDPTGDAARSADLNPHLDYLTSSIPAAGRSQSIGDPRAVAWNAAGTVAYIAGMGSNNLIAVDTEGHRLDPAPIAVGEGPTGIVLDEARERAYVLNKFSASLSVVDLLARSEIDRVPFHDPTPEAIRVGRRHLYDTHDTSGLGHTSCASCHVDARMDRLAWDLGDPRGKLAPLDGLNLLPGIPPYRDFHPMKGPMTTQTFQDIIGHEPLHWRGDRSGIEAFHPAFEDLLGDDEPRTDAEMEELKRFLATIHYPPNPHRTVRNELPRRLPLPGMRTEGTFGSFGKPLPPGNALRGLQRFRSIQCTRCHSTTTGMGPDFRFEAGTGWLPIPPGPNGERHHQVAKAINGTITKIPQLRNMYERTGLDLRRASTAGFGFLRDGVEGSIPDFIGNPAFQNDQGVADVVAFLLAFSGSDLPEVAGEPPTTVSQDTHAGVGRQVTVAGPVLDVPSRSLLNALRREAERNRIGLVAKGLRNDEARGYVYIGDGVFQSDRSGERVLWAELFGGAAPGAELTLTAVVKGSERRLGIDRDTDGRLDRDELDAGGDPADAVR